jgi:hypothetical protein
VLLEVIPNSGFLPDFVFLKLGDLGREVGAFPQAVYPKLVGDQHALRKETFLRRPL